MFGTAARAPYSKQLYHLHLNGGECELLPAHGELTEYIDYYWLLSITEPQLTLDIIPDTAIDLVLSPDIADFAALYFPTNTKFSIKLQGPIHYIGICFYPAAANSLLGSELRILRELEVGLGTINFLDIGSLANSLYNIVKPCTLKTTLDNFWLGRLKAGKHFIQSKSVLSLTDLITTLERSLGNESLSNVSRSLKISERQFRRISNELFGLSPKKIQNVLRLQAALTELFDCKGHQIQDLYYDDSHRIRELKQLTGFTPHQIRLMAEKYNQPP